MPQIRSFSDYITDAFYDDISSAIEGYVENHIDDLDLQLNKINTVGDIEISDIVVKFVDIGDLPGTEIEFDIVVEVEIYLREADYHYDESENCSQWFMLKCHGDLGCRLEDFAISKINVYDGRDRHAKPMSNALVPIIYKKDLEDNATEFLRKHYSEALLKPMYVDPMILAKRMGLSVKVQSITRDFSVFGQLFFRNCDAEIYDDATDSTITKRVEEKTIFVDPKAYFLRNLGAVNNTIVHECVHWDKHKKCFALEQLYNKDASRIRCEVIGGIKDIKRSDTDWMEWQANSLAPRIQMPFKQFKNKAFEYIGKYQKELATANLIDVMEPVIDELSQFFGVSRMAAKIRMVDIGYEDAIGTFNYVDGKYVRPHSFKAGAISKNQTFTISVYDAIRQCHENQSLLENMEVGKYLFVESHLCLNDSKYVYRDENGQTWLTDYARHHMDECCIVFDLILQSTNDYGEHYYTECVLFRDADSGLVFEAKFTPAGNEDVQKKAQELSMYNKDVMSIIKEIHPGDFGYSLKALMKWSGVTVEQLAEKSLISTKTLQRMRNESDYQTTIGTVIALCVGMQLPPPISRRFLDTAGFTIRYSSDEQMIYEFIIDGYYTHTIYECNELLTSNGFKELTGIE